jgi:hypothetical protein
MLHKELQHLAQIGHLAQWTGDQEGELLAHKRGHVVHEEVAIEEGLPLGGEVAVAEGPGKDEHIGRHEPVSVKVGEAILAFVGASVVVATLQAAQAATLDIHVVQVDRHHVAGKRCPEALEHTQEVVLMGLDIGQDHHSLAAGVHRLAAGTGDVVEGARRDRRKPAGGGRLGLDGPVELAGELDELSPAPLREQVGHVGREAAHVAHAQVITGSLDVVVGDVVVEVDRSGQASCVLAAECVPGTPLGDQLDKALVAAMHQADVHGKGPEDAVGGAHLFDDLPEGLLVALELLDARHEVLDLHLVLGVHLVHVAGILQGDAFLTLGAAAQNDDLHLSLLRHG